MIGLLIFLCAFSTSCSKENATEISGSPAPSLPQDTIAINYLALGDSYTIGTGLVDENDKYPQQLMDRLNSDPRINGNEPRVIARNGWTTGNLLFATDTATFDTTYSLVSLLIGVNNQFQNRTIEEYTEEFETLLNRAITYAGNDTSRVFVLSIPDYGVTPFGASNAEEIAEEIDLFNHINRSISTIYGVTYFDITPISRTAENMPNLIAPDNLHPSGEMYSLWIDLIEKDVRNLIDD